MAVNFGGGIGVTFFLKDDGVNTKLAKHTKGLKDFSSGFNDAVTNLKNLSPETKKFREQIEALAQKKLDFLEKGLLSGKISTESLKQHTEALSFFKERLEDLAQVQTELSHQQLEEAMGNLAHGFKTASHDSANFINVMDEFRRLGPSDEFNEIGVALDNLSPRWESFSKHAGANIEAFAKWDLTLGQAFSNIAKAAKDETMKKLLGGIESVFGKTGLLIARIGGGAIKTAFGVFTGFFKGTVSILFDFGKSIVSIAGSLLSKLIPSFSSLGETATWLKDKILGLADSFIKVTLGGLNLTTALEGRLTKMDKQATAIGANFGLTGGALRKFSGQASSMALALNMDVSETTTALKAWERAGNQFSTIGLKSASAVAKMANVTGVNADVMGQQLKKMDKYFGITGKNLDLFMGDLVKFGQEGGDVGQAMGMLEGSMKLMQERAALMGQKLNPDQLSAYGTGISKLGRVFLGLGVSQDEAARAAEGISVKLLESRKSFQNMFAGTESKFSDALLGIGIGAKDINVALDSMKQGPVEFLASLSKVSKESGKVIDLNSQQFNFMRGHFETAFGEHTPLILKAMSEGDETIMKIIQDAGSASKSLSKLTKEGFQTGYTLAERFDLASQRFEMGFRKFGKEAAVKFVEASSGAFSKLNAQLGEIVKDGGPMGTLITKMSEVHSLGGLALIPQTLRPMAAAFGTLAKAMLPTVEALGAFGISVADLFTPLGLFTTAIAGVSTWFLALRADGASTSKALETIMDDIANFLDEIPAYVDKFVGWIENFFKAVDGEIDEGVTKVNWSEKWNKLFNAASKALSAVWGALEKIAKGVWDGLAKGFDPNGSTGKSGLERIGNSIGSGLRKAWEWVVDFAKTEIWPRIVDFATGVFDALDYSFNPDKGGKGAYSVGHTIGETLRWIWTDYVVPAGEWVWDEVTDFFSGFWSTLWGGPLSEGAGFSENMGGTIGSFLRGAIDIAWETVSTAIENNTGYLLIMAALYGMTVGAAFGPVGALIGGLAGVAFGGIFASYAGDASSEALGKNMAKTTLDALDIASGDVVKKGSKSVKKMLGDMFNEAGGNLDKTFGKNAGVTDSWWGTVETRSFTVFEMEKKIEESVSKMNEHLGDLGKNATTYADREKVEAMSGQMKIYMDNIPTLVDAYAKAANVSNPEAFKKILDSLKSGPDAFDEVITKIKDKGIDLGLSFSDIKNAVESADLTDTTHGMKKAVTELNTELQNTDSVTSKLADNLTYTAEQIAEAEKRKNEILAGMNSIKGGKDEWINKPTGSIISSGLTDEEKKKYKDPAFKKIFSDVAKDLDAPVRKTIEEVFSMAFDNAYQKIRKGTSENFIKGPKGLINMEGGFKWFTEEVTRLLTSMWDRILDKARDISTAIAEEVTKLMTDMSSLIDSVEGVQLGRQVVNTQALPMKKDFDATVDKDAQMFDAIHNPSWYWDDYKAVFVTKMNDLRNEIKNLNMGNSGNTNKNKVTESNGNSDINSKFGQTNK